MTMEDATVETDAETASSTDPDPGDVDAGTRDPGEDRLRELYVTQENSTTDIGEMLGVNQTTVSDWLAKHGIETRPRGASPDPGATRLRELYHDDGFTTEQIADEFDVTQACVSNWLSKHDIDTRVGGPKSPDPGAARLRELYHEQDWTQAEIADEYDVTTMTVGRWMSKHGVETNVAPRGRDPGEARLRELYVTQENSTTDIAERFDVSPTTVGNWLSKHDIETRSGGRQSRDPGEARLRELYFDESTPVPDIAELFDVTPSAVYNWMRGHDIQLRSEESGTGTNDGKTAEADEDQDTASE